MLLKSFKFSFAILGHLMLGQLILGQLVLALIWKSPFLVFTHLPFLNFNIVFILALISIPPVLFTSQFSKSRGILSQNFWLANQTPPVHVSIVRLVSA